ncbi:MAG TPA: hypothetical protein VMM92_02275, partial [Thermoanaerobaculia bacterium]|nr:hypothetical protein [Thermoanaerobaculia bacterium]
KPGEPGDPGNPANIEPPPGLLERLKAEIPDGAGAAGWVSPPLSRERRLPTRQRWLIAASLVAMLGAGLASLHLYRQSVEGELAPPAAPEASTPLAAPGSSSDLRGASPQAAAVPSSPALKRPAPAPMIAPPAPPPPPAQAAAAPGGESRKKWAAGARADQLAWKRKLTEDLGVPEGAVGSVAGGVAGGTVGTAPPPAAPPIAAPPAAERSEPGASAKEEARGQSNLQMRQAPGAAGAPDSLNSFKSAPEDRPLVPAWRVTPQAKTLAAPKPVDGAPEPGFTSVAVTPRAPFRLRTGGAIGGGRGSAAVTAVERALAAGRLPRPADVRVEDLVDPLSRSASPAAEGAPPPWAAGQARRLILLRAEDGLPAGARLAVTFDPAAVSRYRQVSAGAVVLFEVDLVPEATAEAPVAILSGASGPPRTLRVADLAATWGQASAGFRLASLAAELGEVLGGRRPPSDLPELLRRSLALASALPGDRQAAELARLASQASAAAP